MDVDDHGGPPRVPPGASAPPSGTPGPDPGEPSAGPASPGRLLVVDDSLVTVDVVSDFMMDQGWEVETALSAAQALEKLTAFTPEVVVSDLNMPDLDGLGLFKRIRQVDTTVPVIMLSGEDRLESVLASMHAGVFDFVQKRDCVHTLPAAALRAVAHCRVVRENRRLNDDLMRMNEALERRVQEQTALLEERMRRAAALETAAAVAPLRKELEIAQHIQTSILPKNFDVPGLQISAHMLPAAVVGGDYFDVRPVPDGAWIGVGDVSGHGLTAGLLMLMIQSGISALTLQQPEALPHDILPHLNRLMWENVRERLGRDDFATLCLMRYFRDGRLLHAGAHEDIIVCRASGGPCERIAAPGTWLGGVRDIRRATKTHNVQLSDGDTVVLFTDGITEARAGDRSFYGLDGLCAAIEKNRSLDVNELRESVMRDVLSWSPTPEDDMTLMVMRYQASPPSA
jgi:serine phosphatase RsbU (regulator of sigma subunit)